MKEFTVAISGLSLFFQILIQLIVPSEYASATHIYENIFDYSEAYLCQNGLSLQSIISKPFISTIKDSKTIYLYNQRFQILKNITCTFLLSVEKLHGVFCTFNDDMKKEEKYKEMDAWRSSGLELERNFTYYLAGHDYSGRPVWIFEIGRWKFSELAAHETKELSDNWDKYIEQIAFRVHNSPKKYPKKYFHSESDEDDSDVEASGWVLVGQMQGFELKEIISPKGLHYALRFAAKMEAATTNMEYGFSVNVNYVAASFINLVRPVLPNAISKMDAYGTLSEVWKPKVLKMIPKKEISALFGDDKDYKPIAVFG